MICRSGMLKLQIRRALQSKTLPYAILALMALVTVCFVQSCLMFWGHDRGEIPSAATQWVGNGLRSNAQLISFLVSYLLFPLTSAIFSMCLFDDKRDRAAYMLAPRSSMRSYLCSGALCSFGMAFVATLFVLLISQALAFLAFPAGTSADAYYGALGQLVTSQDEFALLATQPLSSLLRTVSMTPSMLGLWRLPLMPPPSISRAIGCCSSVCRRSSSLLLLLPCHRATTLPTICFPG